jgi:hypothetical protein
MSKGKHRWKDAAERNDYALIFTPRKGWVRYFHIRKGVSRMVPL